MRFTSPGTTVLMRTSSMGPAAIAASVNRGLPQLRVGNSMMRRGGSVGAQMGTSAALNGMRGPGDPGFLGDVVPPITRAGRPIRRAGIPLPNFFGSLGDTTTAMQGASAGATVGSAIPVIGTAVGLVIGAIAGYLVHTGQGAQRAAQAKAIDAAIAGMTTANHQGAAIPWNGTATQPGLLQLISALMTSGLYMSWDGSVMNSPSVNGNWSTCFQNAVIAVTKAIIANPVGTTVTVPIVISGVSGSPTKNFTFQNPGINLGPDAISANIIMGPSGLMYWIISSIGETAAHAQANASNANAMKVFALMVDHAAYDALPQLSATAAAPVSQVAAPAAQIAPAVSQTGYVQPTSSAPPPPDNPGSAAVISPSQVPALVGPSSQATTTYYPAPSGGGGAVGYSTPVSAASPAVVASVSGSGIPGWALIAVIAGIGFLLFRQPAAAPKT